MSEDGARYLHADWEWYIPLDDVDERFANKQHIRTGFGYRRSFAWRFEVLYMTGSTLRTTLIDIRVKRLF